MEILFVVWQLIKLEMLSEPKYRVLLAYDALRCVPRVYMYQLNHLMCTYNLGQNKIRNKTTPSPFSLSPINDELALNPKRASFSITEMGRRIVLIFLIEIVQDFSNQNCLEKQWFTFYLSGAKNAENCTVKLETPLGATDSNIHQVFLILSLFILRYLHWLE